MEGKSSNCKSKQNVSLFELPQSGLQLFFSRKDQSKLVILFQNMIDGLALESF